ELANSVEADQPEIMKTRASGLNPKPLWRTHAPKGCSRRQFLRSLAAAGVSAPFFISCSSTPSSQPISPSGKLNHACIGVGGMGWNDLQNFLQHNKVQIVALCDVDSNNLQKATQAAPGVRLYSDWRELLEKEGPKIDSVNVAVPDHMHFAIA